MTVLSSNSNVLRTVAVLVIGRTKSGPMTVLSTHSKVLHIVAVPGIGRTGSDHSHSG
jgi:hypothetical protein